MGGESVDVGDQVLTMQRTALGDMASEPQHRMINHFVTHRAGLLAPFTESSQKQLEVDLMAQPATSSADSRPEVAMTFASRDPRYGPARLQKPSGHGYLYLAGEVAAPSRPGPVLPSRRRQALVEELRRAFPEVTALPQVIRANLFTARAFTPAQSFTRQDGGRVPAARFDVAVLVETTTPETARELREAGPMALLTNLMRAGARHTVAFAATNAKRIADVDASRDGLFLFNHFAADDLQRALSVWDHLAGWYVAETQLGNSVLLLPLEGESSDYVFVNHARWDLSLPQFVIKQFSKPSFRGYVLANLRANRVVSMPVVYGLA